MVRHFRLNQAASDYLLENMDDVQLQQLNKFTLKMLSSDSIITDSMLLERLHFEEQDIENILSLGAVDVTYYGVLL